VDPKALQLGVNKIKNLANDALFVECKTEKDRDTLEKELSKLNTKRRAPQKEAPYPITFVRAQGDRRRRHKVHHPPAKQLSSPGRPCAAYEVY
jgi:hypothetical protein